VFGFNLARGVLPRFSAAGLRPLLLCSEFAIGDEHETQTLEHAHHQGVETMMGSGAMQAMTDNCTAMMMRQH
jgi:hypothetical protein